MNVRRCEGRGSRSREIRDQDPGPKSVNEDIVHVITTTSRTYSVCYILRKMF